jgi:hypothetical protein
MSSKGIILALSLSIIMCSNVIQGCTEDPAGPPDTNGTDTTSHDFVWTKYVLGTGKSRIAGIHQVWNDHVLVYGMFFRDEGGSRPSEYNTAEFSNGSWEFRQWEWGGPTVTGLEIVRSIMFGDGYLWAAVLGNEYWLFRNDTLVRSVQIPQEYYGRLAYVGWGSSRHNTYFAGHFGVLAYLDNGGLHLTQLAEPWHVSAMTGIGDTVIFSTNSEDWEITHYYRGVNGVYTLMEVDSTYGSTSAIHAISSQNMFIARGGIMHFDGTKWSDVDLSGVGAAASYCSAGDGENDVVFGGVSGSILHYNGRSWKQIGPEFPHTSFAAEMIEIKDGNIWALGLTNTGYIALHGKRQ